MINIIIGLIAGAAATYLYFKMDSNKHIRKIEESNERMQVLYENPNQLMRQTIINAHRQFVDQV